MLFPMQVRVVRQRAGDALVDLAVAETPNRLDEAAVHGVELVDHRLRSNELVRAHRTVVKFLERFLRPARAELVCLHLAYGLVHPADRVRDEVLVGPAARGLCAEAGTSAIADRGAEGRPHPFDARDKVRGGPRQGGVDLGLVLDKVTIGLADDQPARLKGRQPSRIFPRSASGRFGTLAKISSKWSA